ARSGPPRCRLQRGSQRSSAAPVVVLHVRSHPIQRRARRRPPSEYRTGAFDRGVATVGQPERGSVVAVAAGDLLVLVGGRLRNLGLLAVVGLAELGAQLLGGLDLALDAVLVDGRPDLRRRVLLVRGERVGLVLAERLVQVDELTVRQALGDARLAAVQHLVLVAALEAEADPLGDDERYERA